MRAKTTFCLNPYSDVPQPLCSLVWRDTMRYLPQFMSLLPWFHEWMTSGKHPSSQDFDYMPAPHNSATFWSAGYPLRIGGGQDSHFNVSLSNPHFPNQYVNSDAAILIHISLIQFSVQKKRKKLHARCIYYRNVCTKQYFPSNSCTWDRDGLCRFWISINIFPSSGLLGSVVWTII